MHFERQRTRPLSEIRFTQYTSTPGRNVLWRPRRSARSPARSLVFLDAQARVVDEHLGLLAPDGLDRQQAAVAVPSEVGLQQVVARPLAARTGELDALTRLHQPLLRLRGP